MVSKKLAIEALCEIESLLIGLFDRFFDLEDYLTAEEFNSEIMDMLIELKFLMADLGHPLTAINLKKSKAA